MDLVKRFKLVNNASHLASAVLMVCFFASLVFTLLPVFPRYPTGSEKWGWFITSWNLPGPLMFIIVFRIHALRVMKCRIQKDKNILGITLWVKFWFIAAVAFGLLTLPFLVNTYLIGGAAMPWYMTIGTAAVVLAWLLLLFSSIFLVQTRCSKVMLPAVNQARKFERFMLAPSSIVFLFFSGLSSIAILFP